MKKLLLLLVTIFPIHAKKTYYQDLVADACRDGRCVVTPKSERQEAGRYYYDSLIEQAEKRHWAIPISFNFSFADTGYDCDGCKSNLAATIFGKNIITIEDVYLFSKLSIDNKVRINNCAALEPNRGAIPIPGAGAGAAAVPFGGFSSDLYTTSLAPIRILFDAQQKEFVFIPSILFHYELGKEEEWALSGGINIPIITRQHVLTMGSVGGQLFESAYVPDTTQAANTLNQFFKSFTDVSDFIMREVLAKKGIVYEPVQQKTGFGDISLFASIAYESNPLIEVGVAMVAPTAAQNKNNVLWEVALGVDTFQVNPFMQVLVSTSVPYVNPFIRVAGEFSKARTSTNIRAPRFITNDTRKQAQFIEGLDNPAFFNQYYVDSFTETDSAVALIAPKACMQQKFGHRILLGLGNYSYNVFNENFRLGIYYDYMHKSKDTFQTGKCDCCCRPNAPVDLCLTCTQVDTCTLEQCSNQQAHIISASLTYKFNNLFELGFGGEFVILGKNVPNTKSGYFNLVIVF